MKKAILAISAIASLAGAALSLADGVYKFVNSGAMNAMKKEHEQRKQAKKAAREKEENIVADVDAVIIEENVH